MRISRRQFISSSAATGLAGMVFGRHGTAATGIRSRDPKVSLRASGDARQGYQTIILFDGQPAARSGEGEFSAIFQNSDRSLERRVENWRAASYTGTDDHLLLEGECKLANLNATDPGHPFFGYHRVFAWNAFALRALEMAGCASRKWIPTIQNMAPVDSVAGNG